MHGINEFVCIMYSLSSYKSFRKIFSLDDTNIKWIFLGIYMVLKPVKVADNSKNKATSNINEMKGYCLQKIFQQINYQIMIIKLVSIIDLSNLHN